MIYTEYLTEDDKDRKVMYQNFGGPVEHGVISSWNEYYVFVRYGKNKYAIATRPACLHWAPPDV